MAEQLETVVETYLPVRIGYGGTKVHDLWASVQWNARKGQPGVFTGQTYCGSQRGMSGWYAIDPATEPTCLKCAARRPAARSQGDHESVTYRAGRQVRALFRVDPTTVVDGRAQKLVPTAEVVELVTPGPDWACTDSTIDWTTRTQTLCSRKGPHGDQHAYDGERSAL